MNIVAFFAPTASFGFTIFLAAMIAKNIYVQMAVAKIAKIKAATPPAAQDAAIREAGGLNMTYGYIAGAICLGLIVLSVLSMAA